MSPSDPRLRVAYNSIRYDGLEQCHLPDGRVITRYEHDQLVNIAKKNKILRSLGLLSEPQERGEGDEEPGNKLPASFVMPERREQPDRASKKSVGYDFLLCAVL